MATKERLSRKATARITRYLSENWELFKQERFTMRGLATHIKNNLKIEIDPDVLRAVIDEAEMNWEEIAAPRTMPSKGTRVDRFRFVCQQMAIIGEYLEKLADKAGVVFDKRIDVELLRQAASGKIDPSAQVPRQTEDAAEDAGPEGRLF